MSVEDKIEKIIDWVAQEARDHFEYRLGLPGAQESESPIERLMLTALLAASVHADCCGSRKLPSVWDKQIRGSLRETFLKGNTWNGMMSQHCVIAPQFEIGEYRVDFCLRFAMDEPGAFFHIAVECDGHEWHERTPEQAQRDKARDRAIQAAGFQIMRFTGREIWRDPMKCAEEVFSAASKEWYRRILGSDYDS